MPSTPLFSIIIPVFNVESYLSQCLDSLLAQTLDDFEVILVDDVSTDGSKALALSYAQRFPDKFHVIAHEVNMRQGGARNTGIDAAKGQYILFLDSDDYLKPETLQIVADVMARENASIVEFCHDQVDDRGHLLRRDQWPAWLNAPCTYEKPLLVSGMGPCNKAYRRTLFSDGTIRFPVGHFYEDYWTVPKLLMQAGNVVYLNDPLYCYRQHPGSTTHASHIERNRAVMPGTDNLLAFFHAEELPAERFAELEYLVIEHVLVNATLRVNCINPRAPMQKELKQYVDTHFPKWRKNPYLHMLPSKKQQLLKLIDRQQYIQLYLRWCVRNRITGTIKQVLQTLGGEGAIRKLRKG